MMRIVLLAAAFLIACPTTQARAPAQVPGNELATDDLRQISGIFERWQNAWNSHDMHAFAQLFHEDATWIVWTGRVWRGRQAIEEGHVEAHRTFFRNSTQLSNPQEISLVAPGVVVARSLTTLTGDSREAGSTILGHKLLVLTQRDGVWRILYGQNTRLTPAVAATAR
ncbi:SgcJ/EcaC family oxidoreductase [Sphingomonas sp. BT-65]|uniref:SgcJ/EcaC family oxidoreductase n=1 Tax=Sphingomonas sp. BT-65 TaxID=2989821 RepID=UPI002236A6C3|nr:SgcJ/EcaC family oxidoreductase [Sphingomonas sp. BT-65]MCW4461949.1 SgcJ/EcaC family oxidoreductase [Sphingomonas sp. BT-65]